ncbi:MAG: Ig-like domain-containing protein [Muribaculaceae bacterium]|nr:Ig-like domain-containing protein [Muribaculaceae bacterium]
MKKIYTLTLALLASTSMLAGAQSLSDTETLWAKFVSNSANQQSLTTQGNQMVLADDGDLYVVGQVGSTATDQSLTFGNKVVASGVAYSGNSANQALLVMKLNADGDVQWSINQTNGEASNNESRIACTPDGGAVILTNVRHTEGYPNDNITLTDAAGGSYAIDWTATNGERSYRGLVIKVTSQGSIEWVRELVMNETADEATYPKWSQSSRHIGQGLKTYALDVDNEGNIYVGGIMCATMTIGDVTIEPHNVANWNGNSQNTAGNMYVLKLDADGNYVSHLVSEGEATQENVQGLKVVGDKLYMSVWAAGVAGTEFSIGGKGVTPATTNGSWCLAELDTDLNVNWLKFYESSISGSAWQMPTLVVAGDNIYLMGTAKYGIQIGETTYTNTPANKARQSWIIQFAKADGTAQAATVLATGKMQMQHGFFGGYEGTDGKLYAIERGLTPGTSFGSELILYKLDAATLEVLDQVELATGSCDGQSLVTDGTRVYVMNRFANKNEECKFYNSDITHSNAAFNWGQSAFAVPVGAVKSVTLDVDGEEHLNAGGTLMLTATITPENVANSDIIWSSTDENVVTVDNNGMVTAAATQSAPARIRTADATCERSAIITATSASNPNVKASVKVIVDKTTGITDIKADNHVNNHNVYTIDGRLVKQGSTSVEGLPAGPYIAGGKKVVVR